MRFWCLSGSLENWETALSGNLWGVRTALKSRWEKLSKDDILIFYVKSPISGIIGIGKVVNKFVGDKPYWPDEIRSVKVEYPYRFEFKVEYVLPKPSWIEDKVPVVGLKIGYQSGLNPVSKDAIKLLFEKIDPKWNTNFLGLITKEKIEKVEEKPMNLHDEIKKELLEIGKIRTYISEKEYPVDGEKLDVVWRKSNVIGAVPKYVFEIQIGGDLYHALGKLKHANDKWNSEIFLIIQEKDKEKVDTLLKGTFHEIKDKLKVITVEKIKKWFEIQKMDIELRLELGLI